MKPRTIIGKVSHWGRMDKRSHILTARVPHDFKLVETFLVKILSVPDCKAYGGCRKAAR